MNREELLASLQEGQQTWVQYAQVLPLETYYQALGPGRWSPAQHAQHLTLTHRRISLGLKVPRPLLRLRFGKPPRQRTYLELQEDYRAALRAGGRAPSLYVPGVESVPTETARAASLQAYEAALADLRQAARKWTERSLDSYALPHALIGMLSVREMLYFAIYHNEHHLSGVKAALEHL